MESSDFKRFRETPISKGFDRWPPAGATVRIKSSSMTGVILHQTTRHRFNMMIHIPSAGVDVLCGRKDISDET